MQANLSHILALVNYLKNSAICIGLNINSLIISLMVNGIGNTSSLYILDNVSNVLIVKANYAKAFWTHLVQKLGKGLDNILHSAIMIQMVILYIGYNAYIRIIFQESAVTFISLRYQIITFAQSGIAAQIIYLAANDNARRYSLVIQSYPQHGGSCGFAMSTCYSNALGIINQESIYI